MNNTYINTKKEKMQNKDRLNNYIFGLSFGFSITLIFIFRLLYKKLNYLSIIDIILIFYGIFCILLATINPKFKLLINIRKLNVEVFNFLGEMILRLILVIVFYLIVVPVEFFHHIKKKKTKIDLNTTFVDYSDCYSKNLNISKYKFLKVFRLFSNEYFYMIPLIIILLIISILVVLISSSVFTPLIYTLF